MPPVAAVNAFQSNNYSRPMAGRRKDSALWEAAETLEREEFHFSVSGEARSALFATGSVGRIGYANRTAAAGRAAWGAACRSCETGRGSFR
jgi:hypothetical protein